jgi:glycosyltransferase involved in cell wall biosynthesis
MLISMLKRTPFVFEVRDLWVDFARELGIIKNSIVFSGLKALERFIYKRAAMIVVNSPGFIPYVEKAVPGMRIELVPNGVTTADFENAGSENGGFRKKLGIERKYAAVYTGNVGLANDMDTLIDAAFVLKEREDITIVILGGGMKKEAAAKAAAEKGLRNMVFLNPIPKSQMPSFLAEMDAGIATLRDIPLFATVYPNKVFDYMAAGMPTILAIDGAIRDVIEKSGGGVFVKPGDGRALAAAVSMYADNPVRAKKDGEKARAYVKIHFERDHIAAEFEKLLLSLCAKGKGAA